MAESKKLVHWALNASVSEPFSEASTSSFVSTPNLQYINSQLIAHGFTTAPGLSLDGISKADSEVVAKCLLTMLSQRVDDMSRTEDLSTKLRTLAYDHERLMDMHHTTKEKVASAEREVNQYKSRLATATRALQSSEANRKQTAAELQRTRASLQGIRTAHVTELRKKEKEIERMIEKWNKLAEAQSKVSAASSGISIHGANAEIVSGSDNVGKSKGYLDVALEHAESSRAELFAESTRLRRLVVTCANRIQSLTHKIRLVLSVEEQEEPPTLNHDALFPLAPINAAEERLLSLFSSADNALVTLSTPFSEMSNTNANPSTISSSTLDTTESQDLRAIIEKLQAELEETQLRCESQSAEIQALISRVAEQAASLDSRHLDTELKLAPERERLDRIKKELEDERAKFTEAAVKLIKERTALENDRIKFLEEKRSWHQQIQAASSTPPLISNIMPAEPSQKKSPRKSPRKNKVVGKSSSGSKVRTSRKLTVFSIPPPTNTEPAYETEVIPICVSASSEQAQRTTRESILPTSFVLPPPSPRTSLPPPPNTLLGPSRDVSSGNGARADGSSEIVLSPSCHPTTSIVPHSMGEPDLSDVQPNGGPTPQTPSAGQRPFPMAKPLAPRMTHAYSPAKPSPLSRILMLGESLNSIESLPFPAIKKADLTSTTSLRPPSNYVEDDEDSPLREQRTGKNSITNHQRTGEAANGLPRAKAHTQTNVPANTGKTKTRGSLEKENRGKSSLKISPATVQHGKLPINNKAESSAKVVAKTIPKPPAGRGGARRVPIGSTEAAPGWKG